jgi:hypothetical protein
VVGLRSREHEILFEHPIIAGRKSELTIHRLSDVVVLLDVETDSTHIVTGSHIAKERFVHAPIHALAAPGRRDIDALDPPKCGIAPVAPLVCDEQLSDDGRFFFGQFRDQIKSLSCRFQDRPRSLAKSFPFQISPFCLKGHRVVKPDQRVEVFLSSQADEKPVCNRHRSPSSCAWPAESCQPASLWAEKAGRKFHLQRIFRREIDGINLVPWNECQVSRERMDGGRDEYHQP